MVFLWIGLGLVALAGIVLLLSYIFFRKTFYLKVEDRRKLGEMKLVEGDIFYPYRETMLKWWQETQDMPHEVVTTTSFDGLKLYGNYYEYAPGAPIELMFHGYGGSGERDLCGGVQRCFSQGRSALIVDQRANGRCEGNVVTFGINERRDCHSWLAFIGERFGPDVKIILTGVSMGAATVLMAAAEPLPKSVVGVLADCGYSSAKSIIKKYICDAGMPGKLSYPFVKLGARLFGRFDLEETSPEEAVKHSKVPVLFIHGDADHSVPCEMSRRNYEACTAPKRLCIIPGAGHCLCYVEAPEIYCMTIADFFEPLLNGQ